MSVPRSNSPICPASRITSSGCPSCQASQVCGAIVMAMYMRFLPATAAARGIRARTASTLCSRSSVSVRANRLYACRCASPMRSPIACAFSIWRLASLRSPRSHIAQPRK